MQVQDHVAHLLLSIQNQLERNEEGLHLKPSTQLTSRTQHLRIVDEARWTNQHIGQFLHDSLGGVVAQLEEFGP